MTEENVSYEVNTTNDDREFLDYLLNARDELIKMPESSMPFDSMAILHYGQDSQNACLGQTSLPNPQDYEFGEHYQVISIMPKIYPEIWIPEKKKSRCC